jgi:hypothetical protein
MVVVGVKGVELDVGSSCPAGSRIAGCMCATSLGGEVISASVSQSEKRIPSVSSPRLRSLWYCGIVVVVAIPRLYRCASVATDACLPVMLLLLLLHGGRGLRRRVYDLCGLVGVRLTSRV